MLDFIIIIVVLVIVFLTFKEIMKLLGAIVSGFFGLFRK